MRTFRIAALILFATPGVAHATDLASISSRELLPRAQREPLSAQRFDLVGLHWQGPGRVEFRTRSVAGRWSGWRAAAPEAEDRPDAGTGERSRKGWRLGNPYWTGASNRIEIRTRGAVRRVRGWFVRSEPDATPTRTTAAAGTPQIVPRSGWGANELIKRAPPRYASQLRFAVVHHTAGSNTYSAEQAPAVVKAIQTYHVKGNGWNDIGYNFLVDKYGRVYEGRAGGLERNVIGAHAEGFNTGSFGVALLGTYGGTAVSAAAKQAIVDLIAWRLDVAHVDPLSTFSWTSAGSARYPKGVPVFLRTVSGHRDVGFTSCPGDRLYAALNEIAGAVGTTGLPKVYEPLVRGSLGTRIRFTARLSTVGTWTVTVTDALQKVVATGSGTGGGVDWTWDSAKAPAGRYAWTIATAGARPAKGTVSGSTAGGTIPPPVITPLLGPVGVDPAGAVRATLFDEWKPKGKQLFQLTADAVADGRYRVVVRAISSDGAVVASEVPVIVSRLLRGFAVEPAVFSPNLDGRNDFVKLDFELGGPATVRVRVLKGETWVHTIYAGDMPPGAQSVEWDGAKRIGRLLDGTYTVELSVADAMSEVAQRLELVADSRAPKVSLVSLAPLRLKLDEDATLTMTVNGRRIVTSETAGTFAVAFAGKARRVRVVAVDSAGNVGVFERR